MKAQIMKPKALLSWVIVAKAGQNCMARLLLSDRARSKILLICLVVRLILSGMETVECQFHRCPQPAEFQGEAIAVDVPMSFQSKRVVWTRMRKNVGVTHLLKKNQK